MKKLGNRLHSGFAFAWNATMITGSIIGVALVDRALHPLDTYRDRERLKRI